MYVVRISEFSQRLLALGLNQRYSFLKLPRELRDEIYSYAWNATRIRFLHENFIIDADYSHIDGRKVVSSISSIFTTLPKWVYTNKQILSEALERFYFHADFKSVSSFLFDTKLELRQRYRPILSLHRVRHIYLNARCYKFTSAWMLRKCELIFGYESTNLLNYILKHHPDVSSLSLLWDVTMYNIDRKGWVNTVERFDIVVRALVTEGFESLGSCTKMDVKCAKLLRFNTRIDNAEESKYVHSCLDVLVEKMLMLCNARWRGQCPKGFKNPF